MPGIGNRFGHTAAEKQARAARMEMRMTSNCQRIFMDLSEETS